MAILREGRLVELNQVSHLTHLRQQEVAVGFATAHVRQRASVVRRRRSEEYVVFITLATDLRMQSHGVGMMEAVIAEIAPQARVIHYTHGIADYDTTSAARLLETVRFIMPAIHVCVCDPGVGTARRPLAILTHRGDIVIGPDNGALHPAVAALGGTAELRQISNPAVMRHPVSAVFHGRDVFCPTAAHLAHGLSFQLVGEPVDPAILAPAPYTDATPEEGRWMARVIHVDKFGNTHLNISKTSGACSPHQPGAWSTWCSREVDTCPLPTTHLRACQARHARDPV